MKLHFRDVGSESHSQGVTPLLFSGSALGSSVPHDEDLEEHLLMGQNAAPSNIPLRTGTANRSQAQPRSHSRCGHGPAFLYILGILIAFAVPFLVPLAFSRVIRAIDRLSVHSPSGNQNSSEKQLFRTSDSTGLRATDANAAPKFRDVPPNVQDNAKPVHVARLSAGQDSHAWSGGFAQSTDSGSQSARQLQTSASPSERTDSLMSKDARAALNPQLGEYSRGNSRHERSSYADSDLKPPYMQGEVASGYLPLNPSFPVSDQHHPTPLQRNNVDSFPKDASHFAGSNSASVGVSTEHSQSAHAFEDGSMIRKIGLPDTHDRPLAPWLASGPETSMNSPKASSPVTFVSDIARSDLKKVSDPWREHAVVHNQRLFLSKTFENRLNADVAPILASRGKEIWGDFAAECYEHWQSSFMFDQSPKLEAELKLTVSCGEGNTCTLSPKLSDFNGVQVSLGGGDGHAHFVRTFSRENVEIHRWGPLTGSLRAKLLDSSMLVVRRYCNNPPSSRIKVMSVGEIRAFLRVQTAGYSNSRPVEDTESVSDAPFIYETHPHYHIQTSAKRAVPAVAGSEISHL
jgi:hypothetical protein